MSAKPGFGLTGHQGQTQLVLGMGSFILLDLEVIQVSRVACVVARLMPFRAPLGPCSELVWDMREKQHNPFCEEWSTILPVHSAQERLHATLDTRLPPSLPSSLSHRSLLFQDTMLKANMESCQPPGYYSKATDQRKKTNQEGGGKNCFSLDVRLRY